MASSHSATHYQNDNHISSLNGKAFHTHIPRQYNGIDKTFNSHSIQGGGLQECGICGEILTDCQS